MKALAEPDILFLDEPTSGLDPSGRKLVREVIAEQCHRGATVFLNSHLLGEVEQSCDRVAFIRDGRIIGRYEMDGWQSEQTEVAIKVARLSASAMERLAAFKFQPPLLGTIGASPFASNLVPSDGMVAYAVLYALLALVLAQILFSQRDL